MKIGAIQARREKVAQYLIKGIPETLIAQMLGVSRKTITRDVAFLKASAQNWLDGLAKDGFIFEYRLTLDKLRDHELELQRLFLQTIDIAQKTQILRALDDNAKLYLELLGETPTVHAYKRAVKKLQEQQTQGVTD